MPPTAAPFASSADLVERIRRGDPRAEEELVAQYSPGLRVLLRRLAGDPALAEDLHQETFSLLLTKLRNGELREPEALPGFARSIARNLFFQHCRKEKRYQPLGREEESGSSTQVGERPSPLRQVLVAEEAERVRQLLGEMRFPRDRELLVRFYLTDASKEEICRDLGVDSGLFNRVLYRARQRLRDLWERSEKRLQVMGTYE